MIDLIDIVIVAAVLIGPVPHRAVVLAFWTSMWGRPQEIGGMTVFRPPH